MKKPEQILNLKLIWDPSVQRKKPDWQQCQVSIEPKPRNPNFSRGHDYRERKYPNKPLCCQKRASVQCTLLTEGSQNTVKLLCTAHAGSAALSAMLGEVPNEML